MILEATFLVPLSEAKLTFLGQAHIFWRGKDELCIELCNLPIGNTNSRGL